MKCHTQGRHWKRPTNEQLMAVFDPVGEATSSDLVKVLLYSHMESS